MFACVHVCMLCAWQSHIFRLNSHWMHTATWTNIECTYDERVCVCCAVLCMYTSFRQRCFFIDKIIAHNNALLFRFEIYCFLSFCINHRSHSDILPRNVCMLLFSPFILYCMLSYGMYSFLAFGRFIFYFRSLLSHIHTCTHHSWIGLREQIYALCIYMHVFL